MGQKFKFAIDRGGTFTDVFAKCPDGKEVVLKLLSVDPDNYKDAPREGIRRILEQETGKKMPIHEPIDESYIEWIRMGTTVATNALLERKGERIALIINKGFSDLLFIGNQSRPKLFDLEIKTPAVLYEEVVEVDCRVVPVRENDCHIAPSFWKGKVTGTTKEELHIVETLNELDLIDELNRLKNKGIKSLAVVLMHSYTYVNDEIQIRNLAEDVGFEHVSLSHEVMPMVRIVARGYTACADAYLTPCIQKYVHGFASGFKHGLREVNVLFMQSDGGLSPMNKFNGSRAVLSGPAGGVVGYASTTRSDQPIIGFDMGGTSTDVSRYAGEYEHIFETTTAGIIIQAPQLDVNTVAAGGGSRLFFQSGLFIVGPESAGAHPGPVCYRKDGYLTVTDANLVLGRLLPQYFPHIFGPNENEPLDKAATVQAFKELTEEVNKFQSTINKPTLTVEEVAMGFVKVANETMCRPIRALTQAKGYDTRNHILACFGGAGGQHACAISKSLGMRSIAVHKYAGILSAYGMACADVVQEMQEPCAKVYKPENFAYIKKRLAELTAKCKHELILQGFTDDQIKIDTYLHLRYDGTDCALMCTDNIADINGDDLGNFGAKFVQRYKNEFGFTLPERNIVVDDIRVRGVGCSFLLENELISNAVGPASVEEVVDVYFEDIGYQKTNVYLSTNLRHGHTVQGPAIIIDKLSTVLVEPYCTASISETGDIKITIGDGTAIKITEELDAIQLSIFSHRFMSIAEQMGRILQRTAISTNIKERLDFSCALFGPDGGLVSNAPHIPVHLGAMQETVQYQLKTVGDQLRTGDVILSNHPKAGGSHLPDLTVITPVFYREEDKPVFFVASRGHHADIGGITPGSMPANSKLLIEEGATFKSFFLVKQGIFQEADLIDALMAPGKVPNSSGTRNLSDNLSDLKAQIAANQKGITLVCELIDHYGLNVVQAYMNHIQKNAELAVRDLLRTVGRQTKERTGKSVLSAVDWLDDGSVIKVTVIIDSEHGHATFDFTGTGYEVWGNCNAPRAITFSALIYCLRCMVGYDIPLNQGCLTPVQIIIPKGSLLDPSESAAVVGGNVLTSQRIVDVVFKAFGVVAASQGCTNNVTFGGSGWGYYETVAGGSGAGPSWHGRSGVHVHMTNTRITDPEILERRYPIILNKFGLRSNSGGRGRYHGGDGVIRELLFRTNLTLSVLTERRVYSPYGLCGGEPGKKGVNLLIKPDGRIIRMPSKTEASLEPGDIFRLLTPGAGGYGLLNDVESTVQPSSDGDRNVFVERGSVYQYRMDQESV